MIYTRDHKTLTGNTYARLLKIEIKSIRIQNENLSSCQLSSIEHTKVAHGLEFSIPLSCIRCEEHFSEFENLTAQIARFQPVSDTKVRDLKTSLNDLVMQVHTFLILNLNGGESIILLLNPYASISL